MVSGIKCKKVWANRSGGPYRKQLYVNFAALIWSCMGSTVLCGKELLVACGVYRFLKYFCSPMADHQVIFRYYDEPVQDKVIQNGTYTGKPLLVNCYGFSYLIRQEVPAQNKIHWRCSKRSNNLQCKAAVIQVGILFALLKKHIHVP